MKKQSAMIETVLPFNLRFKAYVVYQQVNSGVGSRLDLKVLTDKDEQIFKYRDGYRVTIE